MQQFPIFFGIFFNDSKKASKTLRNIEESLKYKSIATNNEHSHYFDHQAELVFHPPYSAKYITFKCIRERSVIHQGIEKTYK